MHRYLATSAGLALATAAFAQTAPTTIATPDDGQEIVVSGQRAQLQRSISEKRAAIGVVDVSAADEIGRLPDKNVAEVVEHLPGVGVTYDQGEGRYVAIRGIPSNLNNYTINGIEIGNPDGTTRSLPLDIISGQLLNRVEVAKVKTADMDGQGIGGTINLVTQTAFDFAKRTNLIVSGKAGHQDLNNKVPYQADVSASTRFGPDEQFGIVLGGSYSDRDFNSEGFYPDNWRPDARFARGGVPDNIKYTEYSLDRQRISGTGSLDWHGDHTKLYVRGIYSRFVENEIRPRYRLDFSTAALTGAAGTAFPATFRLNPDGLTGTVTTGTERREDLRLDYKAKWLATGMVGGSSDLGRLKLDYEGAYSKNQTIDRFPIWQFRCNPGAVNFDFTDKVYTAAPVTECTANQMLLRQYQFSNQLNVEKIWQGKIDARYELDRPDSFIKFGAKYRDTKRSFNQDLATYTPAAANRAPLGAAGINAGGGAVCVQPNSANTDQCYVNSPTFNIAALQAWTAANLGTALLPLDAPTTLSANTVSDFNLTEQVAAGYVMANLKFGMLTLTPGLRYEHTKLAVAGFALQNGATILPRSANSSYDDWLPSVIARFDLNAQTTLRLAYSKSLGRPEYSSLSPGGSFDSINGIVSLGNPNLKPYRSDNLDATAEWYFAPGGILSGGAFIKWVKNPIFTSLTVVPNGSFNGQTFANLQITQPFNADSGNLYGVEVQYQQQFTFLPGLLSGFGIQVTGTYVHSRLKLPDGRISTFPSQSKYLYGIEGFYQKGRLEASIAYHNTGASLLAIGTPAYNDQYNDDLRRLDAKASVGVWRDMRVFFEAQNLTDEPTRQYQAGNPNWLIQNERYGRTYYLGLSAKF